MRKFILVSTAVLLTLSLAAQQNLTRQFPFIDRYMDSLIREWQVPGMAVAIVHKDQLIYKKGFGYRDLQRKAPVDAKTNFPIASNTKLFTSLLATTLQVEGRLSLDKPAKEYMPSLTFSTDELNARVSLRDMLSHRTGLPGYDALWIGGGISRDSMMNKLNGIKPRYALREGYIYNNVMYTTAGVVMEKITGQKWEDQIRSRFFEPLQMNRSGFSDKDDRSDNYSLSYFEPDSAGNFRARTYSSQSDALGPAGTIFSNMEDMGAWMIALLNEGNYKGRQVIPAAAIRETMVPQTVSDRTGRWEEISHGIYCLGRSVAHYKGLRIWSHTGSIDGFYSQLVVIPSSDLAIFVIGNGASSSYLRSTMAFPVIDRILNLDRTDWKGRARKDYESARSSSRTGSNRQDASEIKASHSLKEYTGTYTDPMLGTVEISIVNDSLNFRYRDLNAPLYHAQFEQFQTRQSAGMPDFRLNFQTNTSGKPAAFMMNVYGESGLFSKINPTVSR